MWLSKTSAAEIWKNDSLTGVLHGYNGPLPGGGVAHIHSMHAAAEALEVRLETLPDGGGIKQLRGAQ